MTEPEQAPAPALPAVVSKSQLKRLSAMQVASPPQMLQMAIARGDAAMIEKFMDLNDRWEKAQARKAFDSAMADAKAEIKPILKNRRVDFANKNGGGRTQYAYEDLAAIADHVDPILARHGLSYRHKPRQEGNTLHVTCILSHRDGHFEETTLFAPYDNSGNKNPAQAIASAGTFLQRYTLKMALGLAASTDDDGRASGDPSGEEEPPLITAEQVRELEQLIKTHGVDRVRFLRYIKLETLEQVWAQHFEAVKADIMSKRARGPQASAAAAKLNTQQLAHLREQCDRVGVREREVARHFGAAVLEDLTFAQLQPALEWVAAVN
jgi:hypothetical protein